MGRHRLTTKAMAKYVLDIVGVPPQRFKKMRVLYLAPSSSISWTSFFLLHGLRQLLSPELVIDYPQREDLYEVDPGRPFGAKFPKPAVRYFSVRWRLPRVIVDRSVETLRSELEKGHFDLVVYACAQPVPEFDSFVFSNVSKERIVAVDMYDHMSTSLMSWAHRVGFLFK